MLTQAEMSESAAYPRAEHPRPDWQRADWLNLNGEWSFRFDPNDEGLRASWQNHTVSAYDSRITVPFSWASPLSGIAQNVKGIAWYCRSVAWRPSPSDARIFLRFGAVDYACEVWINGVSVGTHRGGYGPFEFEVTDAWRAEGDNAITVRVQDEDEDYQARGKQGYGEIRGIWQPVWLEVRPQAYVQHAKFETRIDGQVNVTAKIDARSAGEAALEFSFANGQVRHRINATLGPGTTEITTSFTIQSPLLWSPEEPNLYEGQVRLSGDFGEDVVTTYFGVREIGTARFDGRNYRWITLNGKPVYLNGTLDQSFHQTGYFTFPSDDDMRNEIFLMKRLGLNFVRIHIKPEEPRKLYWADKLGILVMEDMPCFWGNPDERSRSSYEREVLEVIERDFNHPSIFSWVMFNETWGLKTKAETTSLTGRSDQPNNYLPDTQEWVRAMYRWAKQMDPTRIVEDNSPCNWDHVETDINTWHFYINGYEQVRAHLEEVVSKTFPGSSLNYIGGNVQTDAPLMNSECGNVWGIEGGAGDSDLAWHYRYMLNEFRRHDKICGFVFTEFRDVVNEFNGYYRLDGTDKDFGYGAFVPGMTIADLHAPDFIVIDAPPCQTVDAGTAVTVPLLRSSFSDRYHGKTLSLVWELWYDNLGVRVTAAHGTVDVAWDGFGVAPVTELHLTLPNQDAVAVLALKLVDSTGRALTRNFTTFDVRSSTADGTYDKDGRFVSVPVADFTEYSFEHQWEAIGVGKTSGAGEGRFVYTISLPDSTEQPTINEMEVFFEASAKRTLARNIEGAKVREPGINYMHGAAANVEYNPNTYYMTDEECHASRIHVFVNGERVGSFDLPDDPADSRGVLSWHYQPLHNKLDEAGSYGYLCRAVVPGRIVAQLNFNRCFKLELRAESGGVALYGRNAGRYPIDLMVRFQ
ncbi:glycoside hydrolase family 2 protein [Paenibacillus xerothermodurans]|uniref:Glycoside hydrolase family 2 n=1 Tax=Paenibacillus xerothermodurans TaxID=1977292 RepID=A0A2W1NF02_PAEXE|nr:sugar-binding domain-containing protein [Paenibacillus xerothermodurans]PZE22250.1 glycoside hydrolase family 2 [Paenibacillus xerothermodurans]